MIIDNDESDGLGLGSNVKVEGLAWDPINQKMVGTEDNGALVALITLENGNNVNLGSLMSIGLTDVEGIDFLVTIPEPGTLSLVILGGIFCLAFRHKQD